LSELLGDFTGLGESMTLWILGGIQPMVDFSVERYTLVTEEITQIFHQYLAAVTQVAAAREHLLMVSAQILRRISDSNCPSQGESNDSLPNQLRGGHDTSIA
jgi:hypothetical protein